MVVTANPNIDNINLLIAVCVIVLTLLGSLVSLFVFYKTVITFKDISKINKRLKSLEVKTERYFLNGREMEVVLWDLYDRIQKQQILILLSHEKDAFFSKQLNELNKQKQVCDKHFLELNLLSRDPARRSSALVAISSGVGDHSSWEVIKDIAKILKGEEKKEFNSHAKILWGRLQKTLIVDAKNWTG